MENIRVVVGVPTSGRVMAQFAHSLAGLIARTAGGVKSRPDEVVELELATQESSVIHANRESLVDGAIKRNATHVLFLDDDMAFDAGVLDVLLGRRVPIAAVNYPMKKFPIEFVAVGLDGRRVVTNDDAKGLQDVQYTGFGVALIETRVFLDTPKPWFLPEYVPDLNVYTTEDNPFYRRARAAGFKCLIDHDASKLVAHVGHFAFSWNQWRAPETAPAEKLETPEPVEV